MAKIKNQVIKIVIVSLVVLALPFLYLSGKGNLHNNSTDKPKTTPFTTSSPNTVQPTSSPNTVQPKRNLSIGAHIGTEISSESLKNFEDLQGGKLEIVNLFVSWDSKISDYSDQINSIYDNNSIMMLTWEPLGRNTVDIESGKWDDLIIRTAKELKNFGKELWIGTLHEANGNWYPWCIGDSKINTKDTYIRAYRHCVDIFRKEGAVNAKWIYNVSNGNEGVNADFMAQYPGNNYVDIISIDGYNWGTSTDKFITKWRSFDDIFKDSYNAVKTAGKPIILGEWASTEVGGNKAEWLDDAFKQIYSPKYDQLKALIWFNENKETDWRINSSKSSLNAYKTSISID